MDNVYQPHNVSLKIRERHNVSLYVNVLANYGTWLIVFGQPIRTVIFPTNSYIYLSESPWSSRKRKSLGRQHVSSSIHLLCETKSHFFLTELNHVLSGHLIWIWAIASTHLNIRGEGLSMNCIGPGYLHVNKKKSYIYLFY